jgi:hypothetical protein
MASILSIVLRSDFESAWACVIAKMHDGILFSGQVRGWSYLEP